MGALKDCIQALFLIFESYVAFAFTLSMFHLFHRAVVQTRITQIELIESLTPQSSKLANNYKKKLIHVGDE